MYKNTKIINDTIPSCRIDNLPERYNEALMKKTEVTMKENKDLMTKINSNLIKLSLTITAHRTNLLVKRRAYPIKVVAAGTAGLTSNLTLIG